MAENKNRRIIPYRGGVFFDLVTRLKLIVRLLADRRVSPFIKIIPIGSMFYFIFPDLAPGPIDDAAIIWLGAYVFVELCPPDVVEEHMAALNRQSPGQWKDVYSQNVADEVIEAEFKEE
jgi:hypothetical protein